MQYKSPLFTNTNITPKIKEDFCIYMKATGIVRRIEEYGIIGQKLSKSAQTVGAQFLIELNLHQC